MMIYIVIGSTGMYEDRFEWNVAAFTSEQAANERIYKIRTKMVEFGFFFSIVKII